MVNFPITVILNYGGHYSTMGKWIKHKDHKVFPLMFRTVEELTYSWLVNKISRRLKIDDASTLSLSYIPISANCDEPMPINEDEDVEIYAFTIDKNETRNEVHLKITASKVDDVLRSSVAGNDAIIPLEQFGNDIEYDVVGLGENGYVSEEVNEESNEEENEEDYEEENEEDYKEETEVETEVVIEEETEVDIEEEREVEMEEIYRPSEYYDLPVGNEETHTFVGEWEDGMGLTYIKNLKASVYCKI